VVTPLMHANVAHVRISASNVRPGQNQAKKPNRMAQAPRSTKAHQLRRSASSTGPGMFSRD
jgi:hypothetical protein